MHAIRKCLWIFGVGTLCILLPGLARAQRLPEGVVPQHYDLRFTPDLVKATFDGEETIEVQIAKPVSSITMNAAELEIGEASVTQGDKTQPAQTTLQPEKEQATLTVASALVPGPATLHLKFNGTLNDKLRGFYLAKTRLRNYAVTQFESTDARRAFPSFDEPALKATFTITLIVDKGDTAISNGRLMADVSGPDPDKHSLTFSTTAKMSTYLVAMAVGDFVCSEGSSDNIPIRVCGTPDKKPLQAAALRYAGEILKYYNQYYGIPYPFGKLDIVGAPDFEAGAMENTGAIFYRESLLFIDDKNSSVEAHQNVFEVLAHEMAHQWFGDLVTMKWWDNIWLNESFATWMALKPSQSLHPEWSATLSAVQETDRALTFDSVKNTHAIHARAETPDEINELFDPISYEKGAAVLRMIESYVSPDVFRRGVNAYLRKFQYSNATAEDFWSAMAQASGRPVDRIMPSFVNQAGAPLVEVKAECVTPKAQPVSKGKSRRARRTVQPHPKTQITLSQTRFFGDGHTGSNDGTWLIPVCIKGDNTKPFCQLLGEREQVVPVVGCSNWVFTNGNAVGYYRTRYTPENLKKLSQAAKTSLSTAERVALVRDEAALIYSGQEKIGAFLDLASDLSSDQERAVLQSFVEPLEFVDAYLVTSANRSAYQAWVRSSFRPMLDSVKWAPAPGESEETHRLRAFLVRLLGGVGADPDVIRESTRLARQYLHDPDSVDPNLGKVVVRVAAQYGDSALFDEYLAAWPSMKSPEQFYNVGDALTDFRNPQLSERLLQIAVSPDVRNQDAAHAISRVLENPADQAAAWEWVKAHWQEVEKKTTMSSGEEIVAATRKFCDAASRDDVRKFFSEHKVASAERGLLRSVEEIDACINYRARQQGNLAAWLEQRSSGPVAGTR